MLSKELKALAKSAAQMKVHRIPEPPKPKKGDMAMPAARQERPAFVLSETDLPVIKDWEHGKEYNLLVRVKEVGTEQTRWTNDKLHKTFEICEIAALPHKEGK